MRTGMSLQFQSTPATPVALFPAASTPVTAVPCPCTSEVLLLLSTKFQPATYLGVRSGWVGSLPVSRIATMTFVLPLVVSQAAGQAILGRCHWLEYCGSLGVAAAVTR